MEAVFWGIGGITIAVVAVMLIVKFKGHANGGEVTIDRLLDGSKWRGRWTIAAVGIANLVLHHEQKDRKRISYVMERSNKLPFAQVEGTRFMVKPADNDRDPRKNVIIVP